MRGKTPLSAWRSSIVTCVAGPSRSGPGCDVDDAAMLGATGSSHSSVCADFNRRANGVPSTNCSQVSDSSLSRALISLKSARTTFPFAVIITSVNASPSTSSTRLTRGHQRGRWWGSLISSQSSATGAAIVRLRRAVGTAVSLERALTLVGKQRVDLARGQPLASVQVGELDQKAAAHHLAAELIDELAQRRRGATRGEQVVVYQHAPGAGEGVGVQLQLTGAVLEQVFGADGLIRELAGLAREHEPCVELERQGGAEQEATRLRCDHALHAQRPRTLRQPAHGARERLCVREQRRDVLEGDARCWEVSYLADQRTQFAIVHQRTILRRSRINSRCLRWVATAARFSSASSASLRLSGLRERSAGARICWSRFASRSAEERTTRRLPPPTP